MATIKSYTDLSQSMTLSKILPLESADMYYSTVPVREWIDKTDISKGTHVVFKSEIFAIENLRNIGIGEGDVYAWSLAALLDIIRKAIGYTLQTTYNKNPKVFIVCELGDKPYSIESSEYDNEVDACFELIIKLNELNLL